METTSLASQKKTGAISCFLKNNCTLSEKHDKHINVDPVLAATIEHLLQHGVIYDILPEIQLKSEGV